MRFTISLMLAFAGSETEGQEPRTATGDALAVVQSWKDRSERDVPKEILSMVPIELERFLQEAAIPSEGLLFGYDLRLMSVINTEDLVNEGRSLIIVALVGEKVCTGSAKKVVLGFEFKGIIWDSRALVLLWFASAFGRHSGDWKETKFGKA